MWSNSFFNQHLFGKFNYKGNAHYKGKFINLLFKKESCSLQLFTLYISLNFQKSLLLTPLADSGATSATGVVQLVPRT